MGANQKTWASQQHKKGNSSHMLCGKRRPLFVLLAWKRKIRVPVSLLWYLLVEPSPVPFYIRTKKTEVPHWASNSCMGPQQQQRVVINIWLWPYHSVKVTHHLTKGGIKLWANKKRSIKARLAMQLCLSASSSQENKIPKRRNVRLRTTSLWWSSR